LVKIQIVRIHTKVELFVEGYVKQKNPSVLSYLEDGGPAKCILALGETGTCH
jgi:hypothetical protein